jgi:hypothetical protein
VAMDSLVAANVCLIMAQKELVFDNGVTIILFRNPLQIHGSPVDETNARTGYHVFHGPGD